MKLARPGVFAAPPPSSDDRRLLLEHAEMNLAYSGIPSILTWAMLLQKETVMKQ